jgi:uncharacterized protein
MAMLVAIIADTHIPRGTRRIPEACLERMRAAELIVHAGDFTAAETLTEIESLGPPLLAVHGNVDAPEVMRRLPARVEADLAGARLDVIHDAGPRRGRIESGRIGFEHVILD